MEAEIPVTVEDHESSKQNNSGCQRFFVEVLPAGNVLPTAIGLLGKETVMQIVHVS